MVPESEAIRAWLAQLEAERLVAQSPRLVIDAETLRRHLVARGVHDLTEMSHAFASLLAKDHRRWRHIASHFREHFGGPLIGPDKQDSGPTPDSPRQPIPTVVLRLVNRVRQFLQCLRGQKRRSSGKTRVGLAAIMVIICVLAILNGTARIVPPAKTVNWCRSGLKLPPEKIVTREKQWSLQPVHSPVEGFLQHATPTIAPPPPPESLWLEIILALFGVCIGVVAARWRFAAEDYAQDVMRMADKSEKERNELLKVSTGQGIPYHVERVPPMSVYTIDDAATLLGRITRHEESFDLDIPRTIDRTIAAGGRVVPVHAPGLRREAILMFVDIEEGDHPFRDGVEWILERWQRLGIQFVRYDYRDRPGQVFTHSERRAITLEALARRTEGAPLLIWSRMGLPQDFDGKLNWLRALASWPVRAWIDLDPRSLAERSRSVQRVIGRISVGLPRFSCTSRGLIACATSLTSNGKRVSVPNDEMLKPASDASVEHALRVWAAAACCVPDPTWPHLDSLRRLLPEIANILPDRRYLQRLIDWINANNYSEGTAGLGPSLRFRRPARVKLIAWLREVDAKTTGKNKPIEHRARELLLIQLQAADVEKDLFDKLRRDMKMRVHQAVLDPSKAEELLAEFADSAVAPELRELLAEELELQALGAVAYGSRGWSTTMRHATKTWTTGKGVRVQDLLSLRLWSLRRVAVALFFVGLVGLSWGIWWKTHKRPPLVQQSLHTTGTIYRVVDERPVALADVAPMPFVVLPEGQFLMGSPADEKHHIDDESPQHAISVKPFELATHEVTQKQWKIVMGSGPSLCANGCGDALPVQNVSWYDAATFMNRLTDRENQSNPLGQQRNRCYDEKDWTWDRICTGYRLPTEAEWEYAARAGSTTAFDFGNDHDQLCLYGNGADLSTKKKQPEWFDCNEQCDDGNADLSPVGSYRPNAWGIFDMHGNVYEWVWDVHRPYAGSSGNDTPIKELPDMRRVLRGGSFLSDPGTMRSAYRRASNPSSHNLIMGLRCARSASDGQ